MRQITAWIEGSHDPILLFAGSFNGLSSRLVRGRPLSRTYAFSTLDKGAKSDGHNLMAYLYK